MHWIWDSEKDRINPSKHGISFTVAQIVFNDFNIITEEDDFPHEQRWRSTGRVSQAIITVIHTWPDRIGNIGLIISARKASRRERRLYEDYYG